MACVTLKRSAPFDALGPSSAKRHRCSMDIPCNCELPEESVFKPSTRLTRDQIQKRIRNEVWRMQRRRVIPKFPPNCPPDAPYASDVQDERPSSPEDGVPQVCSQVISRMRQMAIRSPKRESASNSDSDEASDGACSPTHTVVSTLEDSERPLKQQSAPSPPPSPKCSQDSIPLFTMCQVTALCDRLIREREEQLREEYDNILSCKLAEQYAALLKFNQDQLSYRFKDAPMSYVS